MKDIKLDMKDLKTPVAPVDLDHDLKAEEELQIHLNVTLQRFFSSYMEATGYTFPTIITMTKLLVDNYCEYFYEQLDEYKEDPKGFVENVKNDLEILKDRL